MFCYCCQLCESNSYSTWVKNFREYVNKYKREKAMDETLRIANSLRSRLGQALLRQLSKKTTKTEDLLETLFDDFKKVYRTSNDNRYEMD